MAGDEQPDEQHEGEDHQIDDDAAAAYDAEPHELPEALAQAAAGRGRAAAASCGRAARRRARPRGSWGHGVVWGSHPLGQLREGEAIVTQAMIRDALARTKLGQHAAGEHDVGLACETEVGDAVAEHGDGVSDPAQPAQHARLAGARPAGGTVAQARVEGHRPGRSLAAVAGRDLAGEELDRRQALAAPELLDRLAVAGAHHGDAGARRDDRPQKLGKARSQARLVGVGGEQLAL